MARLLSLPAVSAKRRNEARSTIYQRVSQGLLTEPVKLGRSSAWPEDEIEAINAAIIAGASNDELRQLVRKLHADRKARMAAIAGKSQDLHAPDTEVPV